MMLSSVRQNSSRVVLNRWVKTFFGIATVVFLGSATTSKSYVLEGQSWPSDTFLVFQLSLGSPGRTLQDGNTSWNAAVAPVAGIWTQQLQHVHISSIPDSTVPVATGDQQNSVAF